MIVDEWTVSTESVEDASMVVLEEQCSHDVPVLHIRGPLRAPLTSELWHDVRALLDRGKRRILLDLALVSDIDAVGVGELVRAYNMTIAADGVLRIAHTADNVREVIERVGLFALLSVDSELPT